VICSEESVISGDLFRFSKKMALLSMMNQLVYTPMSLLDKVSPEDSFGMKDSISISPASGQDLFALTA
jgi:hypothetical protein